MIAVFIKFRSSWAKNPTALAPARGLPVECGLVSPAPELGDGARDGVVEAPVQRPEVVRADGRVHFQRQVGNGLADVPVVVDDLRHGEPLEQEVVPVQDGALGNLRVQFRPAAAERGHELV
jgi:hypothetical protein